MDTHRFKTKNASTKRPQSTDGFVRVNRNTVQHSAVQTRRARRQLGNGVNGRAEGFHSVQKTNAKQDPLVSVNNQTHNNQDVESITLDMPPETAPTKKGKISKGLRVASKSFVGLFIVSTLVFGYFLGKGILKARNSFNGTASSAAGLQNDINPAILNGEGDGRVNILLLGKGGEGHEAPDLTDTLIVASLDPIENQATLLSIPRDLYVDTGKINAVYANAKSSAEFQGQNESEAEQTGLNAIENTVEEYMGIPIHYHVMVNFTAFKQAVDTVGGVNVDVPDSVYDVMYIDGQNFILDVDPGPKFFDGFEALAYARSRYTSQRGDFDRSERQRLIIIALKDKILSAGTYTNPARISGLIDAFGDNVQSNLSLDELLRLNEIGQNIESNNITSLSLVDPPNVMLQTANIGGLSVVIPVAGVTNYSEVQSFVRNSLKDPFIKREDATIAVYNGTTIGGLAGSRASELESYGYNISQVANAVEQDYATTVLVDLSGGQKEFTKSYLEKRLNVAATQRLPANSTIDAAGNDFVIILGRNESISQ